MFKVLLLMSAISNVVSGDQIYNDVRKNILLTNNYVLRKLTADLLIVCLQHCTLSNECSSVNYNKSEKKCKLLTISLALRGGCSSQYLASKSDIWDYYGSLQVDYLCQYVNPLRTGILVKIDCWCLACAARAVAFRLLAPL